MKYIAPLSLLVIVLYLGLVGVCVMADYPNPIRESLIYILWTIFWGALVFLFCFCINWITTMVDGE